MVLQPCPPVSCATGHKVHSEQFVVCTSDTLPSTQTSVKLVLHMLQLIVCCVCSEITCPDERHLEYGTQSCDRLNEYQSVCEYTCNHGYELVGTPSRQCMPTGKWDKEKPSCQSEKSEVCYVTNHPFHDNLHGRLIPSLSFSFYLIAPAHYPPHCASVVFGRDPVSGDSPRNERPNPV